MQLARSAAELAEMLGLSVGMTGFVLTPDGSCASDNFGALPPELLRAG